MATNSQEKWQIEAGGKIYEAEFGELESWIHEGSLLRKDLVRRGSLRWIEAEKVPALIEFFNAKDSGIHSPTVISTTVAPNKISTEAVNIRIINDANQISYTEFTDFEKSPQNFKLPQNTDAASAGVLKESPTAEFCCFHPEIKSFYFCETCANGFCKKCPKSYGGAVKVCPCCGAMCESLKEKKETAHKNRQLNTARSEGFGFGDFAKALIYPFKFKASLIFGCLFYAFFAFGQTAAAFGGVMMFAALICYLGTNMLGFGILANTIDNFSRGKIDADFMPAFENFSIWEDVVHPFLLSIGVYLVSFGLFLVILIGGIWLTMNANNNADNQKSMEKAAILNDVQQQKTVENTDPNQPMTVESQQKLQEDQTAKIQTLTREIQQKESTAENETDSPLLETDSLINNFPKFAPAFILCLTIALLWGIFYFPAACAVAGYTRSFAATLNIFVGFDTIKRLGADYLKILLMFFALCAAAGLSISISGKPLSAFDMPMMGNVPLKIISGILTFYLTAVFACVLGFAIYKNADKLDLLKS